MARISKKPKSEEKIEQKEEIVEISAIDAIQLQLEKEQIEKNDANQKRQFELEEKQYALQLRTVEKDDEHTAFERSVYNINCLIQNGFSPDQRIINLAGEIDGDLFCLVNDAFIALASQSDDPIIIRINSLGGSMYDSLAICGLMQSCKCQVIVEVFGTAMSAAILLLAAGDHRIVNKYARLMDHSSAYAAGYAKLDDHRSNLDNAEEEQKLWNEAIDGFCGKPAGTWARLTSDRRHDIYFSAEKALELGLCDEIS